MARGRLRVYVGVAPGAGATWALLGEAERRVGRGRAVLLGPIDTRDRPATAERLADLRRRLGPDLDLPAALELTAVLAAHPEVVILDDLAAVNPPGARTAARWQDAVALLDAGIDVVGTVRVDQIESLSDLAANVTGVRVATVPDALLKAADQLELVDITPDALRRRLAHGALGDADAVDAVTAAGFQPARLARLRELAVEWMADRVEAEADRYRAHPAVAAAPDEDTPTVAVALNGRPGNDAAVRRAARLADRLDARLVGLARVPDRAGAVALGRERHLVTDLGGEVRPVVGDGSACALVEAARAVQAHQLVVGSGDDIAALAAEAAAGGLDLHVVPAAGPAGAGARSWRAPVAVVVAIALAAVVGRTVHFPDPLPVAITIVATAITIGVLVWGARTRAQAERVRAEADELATTARTLVTSPDPLDAVVSRVQQILGVTGVAVIAPGADGPVVECAVGAPVPVGAPDAAADIDRSGRVLAVTGRALNGAELRLLRGYAAQVAAARQHRVLHREANQATLLAEADTLRTAILRAVSHDLHTPLASIKASVSGLLQADVSFSPADRHELLVTIETEADRLHRMVTNLLDVSRLQAGALQVDNRPSYLEDVVAAALANVAHQPDRVEVAVPETLPPVLVDPALLERALANLIANALAWSPADRPVRIDAGAVDHDAEVHVRVVDRGPGIPPDERGRVLEPFQRIGRRSLQAGAGLGLTVVKGFVEAVGGTFTLDDTPGGGLTATIALRAAPLPRPEEGPT